MNGNADDQCSFVSVDLFVLLIFAFAQKDQPALHKTQVSDALRCP